MQSINLCLYGQLMQLYIVHVLVHTFKSKILLYEKCVSRLNILGAGDSTGTVRSSPLGYKVIFLFVDIRKYAKLRPREPVKFQ